MLRAFGALLAGLVLALPPTTPAAEAPAAPAGTWKVILPFLQGTGSQPVWLLKLEKKDGKWGGSVVDTAPRAPKVTVENVSVAKDKLRFTLKATGVSLPTEIKLAGDKADTLFGAASLRGDVTPVQLERTDLTALTPFGLTKERFAKMKPGYEVVQTALALLQQAADQKAKPEEVRSWAAKAVKSAALYGDRWQRDITLLVARVLGREKGYDTIALQYARQAERLLENKDTPATKKRILDVLAAALEKAGKADEAKEIKARIAKLDFRIKVEPFAGRKGKSDRAVLVEFFTGADCKDCVAAELAFDALGQTYKPGEVVLLEYHLSRPGPDPLANPAAEARAKFYGPGVGRLPALFVDANARALEAGDASDAPGQYESLLTFLAPTLERAARAKVKATASRKGDKVDVKVDVSGVKDKNDEIRLRVVLVEAVVNYSGGNKLPVHHHVVRAFVGAADGYKLKGKDLSKSLTVDLTKLGKELKDAQDKEAKKKPFPAKVPALDAKKLQVVAFVQNDETGEVFQAVQAPVKE